MKKIWVLQAVLLLGLGLAPQLRGEISSPSVENKEAAAKMAEQVVQNHFLKARLSEFSEKIHLAILDRLDPEELYLTKEDLAELEHLRANHGEWLEKGDLRGAWEIYTLLLTRKEQALGRILGQLATGQVPEGDSALERFVREDMESRVAKGRTADQASKALSAELEKALNWTRDMTSDQLTELYLDAAAKAVDPHSSYMSEQTFKDYMVHLTGSLEGIGVSIAPQDGYLEIREVIPGGGAAEEGSLKVGHRIVAISQDGENFDDVEKIPSEKALQLIRGESGTQVHLRVQTREGSPPRIITIARKRVELQDAKASGQVISLTLGNRVTQYGVIDIPSFYTDPGNKVSVAQDVYNVLQNMAKSGAEIRGMVIDLRGNGGGSLGEVINLLGMFLGEVPVVQVSDSARSKVGKSTQSPVPQIYGGPLVVLIDKRSASASEIFAGAIQDYGRGMVVGDSSTFGKGSVQTFFPLQPESLGTLKLTIQGFYRPSGDSTQEGGVLTNLLFPSGWDQKNIGESTLENVLAFPKIEAAMRPLNTHIPDEMVQYVTQRHLQRLNQDPALREMAEQAAQYRRLAQDPELPNPTRDQVNQLLKLGALGKASDHDKEKSFGEDVYSLEVIRILHDYAIALDRAGVQQVVPKALIVPRSHLIGPGNGLVEQIESDKMRIHAFPCNFGRLAQ